MGVMPCSRKNCDNILCERYNDQYGYICNSCYEEMVTAQEHDDEFRVFEFMKTPAGNTFDDKTVDLNRVFPL